MAVPANLNMVCPRCGGALAASSGRCTACGAALDPNAVVAAVMTIDTTGLPPDALFGPSNPVGAPGHPIIGTQAFTIGGSTATGAAPHALSPFATTGPLHVGQSLGPRYHIIKLLGIGGMGAVYQAWDAELSVAVALKVIRTDSQRPISADAEKHFKQELLLARQVTHKNVVRIHDLGEIGGVKYLTMPYVKGVDLATAIRESGRLPVDRALPLAREIAAGLQAAHEAGVVHRDLKPANIMVTGGDDDRHALIMDFGISASADASHDDRVVGTLEYMAPEQAVGRVDARVDVYALGLILYEMLTGPRPVVTAETRLDAMRRRFADGLPPMRTIDPSIPEALDAVVMKCVASNPAERYESGAAIAVALGRLDDAGRPIVIPPRFTKRLVAASIAVMLSLVALTWWLTWRPLPDAPHDPVSVVVADVQNSTTDPTFANALAQTVRRGLEGASFISAYDRTRARQLGVAPPERLDADAARALALKQGLGIVVSGSIQPRGGGYEIAFTALETVSGRVVSSTRGRAANKDDVLSTATTLTATIRKALGDRTSTSAQLFAMKSLTASSLDVVTHYAAAVEAQSRGKMEDARQSYLKAVALDPTFGLGYQGLAVMSRNLGRMADADTYIKEALRYLDGMTDRERLGTRGYYDRLIGDNAQCAKEYGELLSRYPADVTAHNQRAGCLQKLRKLREAVDELESSVRMLPNHVTLRTNLGLLKALSGNFAAAEEELKQMAQPDAAALQALAYSQMGRGLIAEATETFNRIGAMGAKGASAEASGLGDLAIYDGRYSAAVRILRDGAAADLQAKDADRAAIKLTSVAYARAAQGDRTAAIIAADAALANGQSMAVRFLAARVYAESGAVDKARALARTLASDLAAEPQAHGKIIEGVIALGDGRPRDAIKILSDSVATLDTWFGHFDLGRAYLAAGALPQADSEFDLCLSRRGEALSLLDEGPTWGYFPVVYYYQGRVRDELKTARFADSYGEYLKVRGGSTEDRFVPDARTRAAQSHVSNMP